MAGDRENGIHVTDLTIDLNADLGELPERLADGSDAALMRYITSANIACGGHAGDAATMEQTLGLAQQNHVAAGAHPGYPDRAGFGRTALNIPLPDLESSIADQINALFVISRRLNIPLVHVKPHGALYHSCNHDAAIARIVGRAVLVIDPRLIIIGQAGASCLRVYREMGLRIAAEAFADRAYEPDGSLRNRALPGAVLDSPELASAQAISLVTRKRVLTASSELAISADTLCIHSDTTHASAIARRIREQLAASGVDVRALGA